MLAHNSTNNISNGHHAEHSLVIYDRDVSDPVIWKKKGGKETRIRTCLDWFI
jgi:hypothetical protein